LRKILTFVILFLFIGISSYAQYSENRPEGLAPYSKDMNPISPSIQKLSPNSWNGRGFAYNAYCPSAGIGLGPVSTYLNTGNLTLLLADPLASTNFVAGASFDNLGNWWGVRYSAAAPFQIIKIDTATGVITNVVTTTTSLTGLAWDFTTSTMYAMSFATNSTLGTINLTTGVFTPLPNTITGLIIDIACSNSGQIFGVNTTSSSLYSIDKTTGIGTLVGPLGITVGYAQGMSWDHNVDSCYQYAYNTGTSAGELRKINTTTGASTLVATSNPICEIDGFAIPGSPGPQISHTPLTNTQNVAGPYVVNATITPIPGTTLTGSKVFWSRNNPVVTDSVSMTNSGSNYTGNIPGNGTNATYRYFIKAFESDGKTSVTPLFTFTANATDTVKPVITHTAIQNTPKTNWPIAVTATVTDNIGIDSAWVIWRINSGVNKRFKILNTTGNTYTALFNSVNADVAVGNTIYYKIFAQDNSAQHNRDSSAAYSFTIINQATSCIGNGTVQMGSTSGPFNTYWYGNRTNILWTSAEILANGGAIGSITRIGFDIATVGGQAMTGLTFRFQNTTATTLSAFVSTGWTTAYSNTFTFPGTGMQYIDLTTPFNWDGTNLLMEICFQNTAYSTATVVNGTTISGMEWTEYHDLSTACSYTGFTAGTAQTARVNTCLVIVPPTGITPVGSTLPKVYSLSQNYPNPFNPVTKINFALPKQGMVTLKIYDVLGREVRSLVNEVKSAGNYSVDFNASEFASGVYFYRLESEGFSNIKRMMLIK